jgi:hypothetical protein
MLRFEKVRLPPSAAKSATERALVTKLVLDIDGVTNVINNMNLGWLKDE